MYSDIDIKMALISLIISFLCPPEEIWRLTKITYLINTETIYKYVQTIASAMPENTKKFLDKTHYTIAHTVESFKYCACTIKTYEDIVRHLYQNHTRLQHTDNNSNSSGILDPHLSCDSTLTNHAAR